MTTLISPRDRRAGLAAPLAAGAAGAAVFAVSLTSGAIFDLNRDPQSSSGTSVGELAVYAGLVVSAVVVACTLAAWAYAGAARRVAGTALGLAIASVVTVVGFWSGWPQVLAAVSLVLAGEHHRRTSGWRPTTVAAVVLGSVGVVAATLLCVLG